MTDLMSRNRNNLAAETGLLSLYGGILATLTTFASGGSDAAPRIPAAVARTIWVIVALAPAVSYLVLARRRVSADDALQMRWNDEVVAETTVAAHGYFVISALIPCDAQITVEAK